MPTECCIDREMAECVRQFLVHGSSRFLILTVLAVTLEKPSRFRQTYLLIKHLHPMHSKVLGDVSERTTALQI